MPKAQDQKLLNAKSSVKLVREEPKRTEQGFKNNFPPRFIVAALLLLLALFVLGRSSIRMFGRYIEARERVAEARAQLEELKEREKFLRAEIERLSSARGVEEELRKQFNVTKEGEETIVIVDEEKAKRENVGSGEESLEPTQAAGPWYTKIFGRSKNKNR